MNLIYGFFRGIIVCDIKKNQIERFFNLCHHHGISLWKITDYDTFYRCTLYYSDFPKLQSLTQKVHIEVHIHHIYGIVSWIHRIKTRTFFLIGFLLCAFSIYFFQQRCWSFEFIGNSYYTDTYLEKYLLLKTNYHPGTLKSRINLSKVEQDLRSNLTKLSWISANLKGTCLQLYVTESITPENSTITALEPIIAKDSGYITKIIPRKGTCNVSLGQYVHKGDLLIESKQYIYNDSMELIKENSVPADGDVYAQVVIPYTEIYPFYQTSKRFYKKYLNLTLNIGRHQIHLTTHQPQKDTSYEHISQSYELNNRLSIYVDIYLYYETIPTIIPVSLLNENAVNKLNKQILDYHEKGMQILENSVNIIMYEDRLIMDGYIHVIKNIASKSKDPK